MITFECDFAPIGGFCYLFTKLLTEKRPNWEPYLPDLHEPGKCPIDRLLRRNKVTFIVDKAFFVTLVASARHFKVFIVRGESNNQVGHEFVCYEAWKSIKSALLGCLNKQIQRFKPAFKCSGHQRDYKHDGHLMVIDRESINSAEITAECEKEGRKVIVDTDNHSVMVWFQVSIIA